MEKGLKKRKKCCFNYFEVLQKAIWNNDHETMRLILSSNVKLKDNNNTKYFLRNKITRNILLNNPKTTNLIHLGQTIRYLLYKNASENELNKIINHAEFDLSNDNKYYSTIYYAALYGQYNILKKLVNHKTLPQHYVLSMFTNLHVDSNKLKLLKARNIIGLLEYNNNINIWTHQYFKYFCIDLQNKIIVITLCLKGKGQYHKDIKWIILNKFIKSYYFYSTTTTFFLFFGKSIGSIFGNTPPSAIFISFNNLSNSLSFLTASCKYLGVILTL